VGGGGAARLRPFGPRPGGRGAARGGGGGAPGRGRPAAALARFCELGRAQPPAGAAPALPPPPPPTPRRGGEPRRYAEELSKEPAR